ncbi:MAG: hypothetical protein AAGA75_03685 [Cyanobacteria bacterium P01_E01_bin.6]
MDIILSEPSLLLGYDVSGDRLSKSLAECSSTQSSLVKDSSAETL